MRTQPTLPVLSLALLLPALCTAAPDFARDVRPLLVKHCYACHGPDKQKGDLRLDTRAGALKGGESGAAVIPNASAKSLLFQRVSSTGSDKMPPKGDALTAAQVQRIQEWIDAGAVWPDALAGGVVDPADWWSLKPLRKPAIPKLHPDDASRVRTPVDAFILAKLREQQFKPVAEADRRTLIRRLSFDLLGLPPTAADMEAFVNDPDPKAYEKLVERFLASPHYGERWARHWLDVVHYGDTHGYDKDQPRPNAYPYRDYVIRSFNADKPYARFVQEQIAGDGLFPNTVDGIEALGFIAAGPWDFIGHVEVPETKIDGKVARHLDRDDMVSNTLGTFMSLTAHCAQCHNHKFDPITQEDYYRLQAVFAAVDRADQRYDRDPAIAKRRVALVERENQLTMKLTALDSELLRKAGSELRDLDAKIAAAAKPKTGPRPEYGYHSAIAPKDDGVKWVQIDLGAAQALVQVTLVGCYDDFNQIGAGFGFPVRFKIEIADDPNFKRGVQVIADHTRNDVANPGVQPQTFPTTAKGRYLRITATKLALRMNDYIFALAEVEAIDATGKNHARGATVTALDSIEALPRWSRKNLTDGISYAVTDVGNINELQRARTALVNKFTTDDQRHARTALESAIANVRNELKTLPPQQTAYIGAVHKGTGNFLGTGNSGGQPRPIHLLARGNVTKPGKLVDPGAILGIPGLQGSFTLPADAKEGQRRIALANWLTDPKNPLTWRSIVNRVWLYHFGRGIVDTPNDFGRMGQLPSHPDLLDYLAADFRDEGQSLKALHRMLVNSSTYRQVSIPNAEQAKRDANNVYYAHMNRRRLEAEAIRDSMLFVAGKLDTTLYGPAFRDFVVEKPEHSPHYQYHLHDADDPKTQRRSIYRFIVRSQLQPFLTTLDCADPSLFVDKRNQTISPLQALTMLNNQLCLVMAKHFAVRVEKAAPDMAEQMTLAFRLALGRKPTPDEHSVLTKYAQTHGLANACRMLFNVNEFIFVD